MSNIKRHLEDISDAIGFKGEINERVICTASLVDEMAQSYVINSDTAVTPISELVMNLKYYYRHGKLDELKRDLIKLVTNYTFEELSEYYQQCTYEYIEPQATRLAWIYIRDNRYRALIHKVTTDTIQFSPAGGGFVKEVKRDIARLEYVDKFPRNWVAGFFRIEDDKIYQGFHDPEARWNGWAMPYFTRTTANAIVSDLPELEDGKPYGYFEGDVCFIYDYGLEDYESYKPTSLEGVDELVYGIGAGSWVWDSVEESEYEYQQSGFDGDYDELLEDRRGF
jgi:hypothetical protein